MICKSTDGKQRVLSLSYGKDSMKDNDFCSYGERKDKP